MTQTLSLSLHHSPKDKRKWKEDKKREVSMKELQKHESSLDFLSIEPTRLICLLNFPGCLMGYSPYPTMEKIRGDYNVARFWMDTARYYSFVEFSNIESALKFVQENQGGNIVDYKVVLTTYCKHLPDNFFKLIHSTLTDPETILSTVPGLIFIPNFISDSQEARLIQATDDATDWITLKERNVHHFGHIFSYKTRRADPEAPCNPMPDWTLSILENIKTHLPSHLSHLKFNQLTINDYQYPEWNGTAVNNLAHIPAHADTHSAFEAAIPVVSLAGDLVMDFVKDNQLVQVFVPRKSLLIMSDEARYGWTHGIRQRRTDSVNGEILQRTRRISLTFRACRWTTDCNCKYPNLCDAQ